MSINTTPIFYYGYDVTVNDIYINFDEGLGPITALVTAGSYSFSSLANAVASAMNNIGSQEYTVTPSRDDRTYTISSIAPFDLLFGSGDNSGLSIASVIGFDNIDYLGLNSYTGNQSGSQFIPQFLPQSYVSFDDFEEFAQASVNESASGKVEVYSIGKRRFLEFNLTPITNNPIIDSKRSNSNAVGEIRDFLRYCITKGELEYMEDLNDRAIFNTILLESTATSQTGTGFKLRELYSRGLTGFFETGRLRFREVV